MEEGMSCAEGQNCVYGTVCIPSFGSLEQKQTLEK